MGLSWFLRLNAVYLHGVLLAACFDLCINLKVANKFLFPNVFKICVELHNTGAL